MTVFEILFRARDREIEPPYLDPRHFVARKRSALRIGIGECVAEALVAWIGVTLDNRHPTRHGQCSSLLGCSDR
jgi:hypothetical protein